MLQISKKTNTKDLLMTNCWATELWESGYIAESSVKPKTDALSLQGS